MVSGHYRSFLPLSGWELMQEDPTVCRKGPLRQFLRSVDILIAHCLIVIGYNFCQKPQ
jgi:hypothetical protein